MNIVARRIGGSGRAYLVALHPLEPIALGVGREARAQADLPQRRARVVVPHLSVGSPRSHGVHGHGVLAAHPHHPRDARAAASSAAGNRLSGLHHRFDDALLAMPAAAHARLRAHAARDGRYPHLSLGGMMWIANPPRILLRQLSLRPAATTKIIPARAHPPPSCVAVVRRGDPTAAQFPTSNSPRVLRFPDPFSCTDSRMNALRALQESAEAYLGALVRGLCHLSCESSTPSVSHHPNQGHFSPPAR